MNKPLRIALTKGRLEKDTVGLLEKFGYDCTAIREKGRKLILPIGDGSIENVPLGTAKAGLKIAKIFLKLAKAFIKVGDALGFIDGDKIFLDLVNSIAGMINNGGNETPAEPAPETPAEPVNP